MKWKLCGWLTIGTWISITDYVGLLSRCRRDHTVAPVVFHAARNVARWFGYKEVTTVLVAEKMDRDVGRENFGEARIRRPRRLWPETRRCLVFERQHHALTSLFIEKSLVKAFHMLTEHRRRGRSPYVMAYLQLPHSDPWGKSRGYIALSQLSSGIVCRTLSDPKRTDREMDLTPASAVCRDAVVHL